MRAQVRRYAKRAYPYTPASRVQTTGAMAPDARVRCTGRARYARPGQDAMRALFPLATWPLPAAHPRAARSFGGSASPGAPSPVGRLAGGLRAGATVLTLIFGSHPVRLALWASSRPATRPVARPARLRSQPPCALFGRGRSRGFQIGS